LLLVEKDLQDGKLVSPFGCSFDLGDHTYYLITPDHRPESPDRAQANQLYRLPIPLLRQSVIPIKAR
jgi:hypothetical protein